MILSLSGTIKDCADSVLTIEVNGVGYAVHVPQPYLFPLGQQANVLVHMHWNSENGPSLFGFANNLERSVFLMITSCSGLGPKLAMAVLAQLGASEFLEAVQAANEDALSNVSGIGAKKAEQIIVQLKHKVAKLVESGVALGSSQTLEKRHEISQVLKSLNYSPQEIRAAMAYVNDKYPQNSVAFDQLVRHALAFLAKRV
ncbi:MAG: Holliday junction ATP-dependent DNA helicase RuvA [Candidatus Babeliales bacterium]